MEVGEDEIWLVGPCVVTRVGPVSVHTMVQKWDIERGRTREKKKGM